MSSVGYSFSVYPVISMLLPSRCILRIYYLKPRRFSFFKKKQMQQVQSRKMSKNATIVLYSAGFGSIFTFFSFYTSTGSFLFVVAGVTGI